MGIQTEALNQGCLVTCKVSLLGHKLCLRHFPPETVLMGLNFLGLKEDVVG